MNLPYLCNSENQHLASRFHRYSLSYLKTQASITEAAQEKGTEALKACPTLPGKFQVELTHARSPHLCIPSAWPRFTSAFQECCWASPGAMVSCDQSIRTGLSAAPQSRTWTVDAGHKNYESEKYLSWAWVSVVKLTLLNSGSEMKSWFLRKPQQSSGPAPAEAVGPCDWSKRTLWWWNLS